MLETSLKICQVLDKYEYEHAEHNFGTNVPAWADNMQEFRILNISEEDKEKILNDIDVELKSSPKDVVCQHEWTDDEIYPNLLVIQIRVFPKGTIKDLIINLETLKKYGIVVSRVDWHYLPFWRDDEKEYHTIQEEKDDD